MIEIKSYRGEVLHRSKKDTIKAAMEEAVRGGAYLGGAYLDGANLDGANLDGAKLGGAYLVGAKLGGAKLIGPRPVFMLGPIGSRAAHLISYLTDEGIEIMSGCWTGSLAAFVERVKDEHGDNPHGREYMAAVAMIEAHAALWTTATAAPSNEMAKEAP